jgi:exportin-2 (importin alpha re-exporter)
MVALVQQPQSAAGADAGDDDPDAGLTAIDFEEQTAGYQAAYSRLAAAEGAADPAVVGPFLQAMRGAGIL